MWPMKEFPPFRLDARNQCLWRTGEMEREERIPVTPKAFAVLQHLVERAGRLVTHEELLDARNALGDRPKNSRFIETVPKRGYRFIAPVSEHTASGPSVSVKAVPGT